MHTFKSIYLAFAGLAKQAWLLPESVANVFRTGPARVGVSEAETERLDRIRNPSKYLGK